MQAAHNGRNWTETFVSLLYRQNHFRKETQPGEVRPAEAVISHTADTDSCGHDPVKQSVSRKEWRHSGTLNHH